MKNVCSTLIAVFVFGLAAFAQEVPKAELFLGYEYVRFNPAHEASGNKNFNMNGGGGAIMFNLNRVVGLKAEFTGAGAGDMRVCNSLGTGCLTTSGNFFTYLFGPQFTLRKSSRVQPFAHVLFGGAYSNVYGNITQAGTISLGPTTADFGKHAFALAVGGGLDVKVSRNVAIRLGQFDYFMTRFSGRWIDTTGSGAAGPREISNQSNFRYLAGINFHIGRKNILPPSVSCSAARPSIIQEETTTIQAKATDPEGAGLKYSWNASGGAKVSGSGDSVTFDATGLAPGKYVVTVTVFDGKYKADCSTEVTVIQKNRPPTATVEPGTFSVTQGESANLRCNASDPDNDPLSYAWSVDGQQLAAAGSQIAFGSEGRKPGTYTVTCAVSDGKLSASSASKGTIRERIIPNQPPTIECLTTTLDVASGGTIELRAKASDPEGEKLSYSWSATGGSVSGTGETATFNAAGVKAGSYAVTTTVTDSRGGKASCSMTVNVSERLSITKDKCGFFTSGQARVDNCAKAILDDLAVRMKNDPKLRANVIGYTDGAERQKGLGEKRAKAVAAYLEKQGVEASRMIVTDGGLNNPAGDNKKAAGRTLNRRVEIELSVH
jgi:outer membrane protein OmpA-like peptidoglycan-associated protein